MKYITLKEPENSPLVRKIKEVKEKTGMKTDASTLRLIISQFDIKSDQDE